MINAKPGIYEPRQVKILSLRRFINLSEVRQVFSTYSRNHLCLESECLFFFFKLAQNFLFDLQASGPYLIDFVALRRTDSLACFAFVGIDPFTFSFADVERQIAAWIDELVNVEPGHSKKPRSVGTVAVSMTREDGVREFGRPLGMASFYTVFQRVANEREADVVLIWSVLVWFGLMVKTCVNAKV